MDLEEIRKLKAETEQKINDILADFQDKTKEDIFIKSVFVDVGNMEVIIESRLKNI